MHAPTESLALVTLQEDSMVRPESELGRGRYAAPKWVILGLGALSLVVAVLMVIVIVRKRLKERAGDDLGPVSSRGSVRPGPPSNRPPR